MTEQGNENPRATVGHNDPPLWAVLRSLSREEDFASTVTAFLNEEYRAWDKTVADLLEEARALPREIPDAATRELFPPLIKRIRDTRGKLEAFHKLEKEPYHRGGQAVDQKFFGLIDKLLRRDRKNNPGAGDILGARLTDYDTKVLAAEQERRRLEAEEAARVAREAQERAQREAREAEEKRLAAERARKPEIAEEKRETAQRAEHQASAAHVEAVVETARAEEAHVATLVRPADIMRTRGDDGTLSTMAQEKYAELEDRDLLDKAALWPFIPEAALKTALTQWAKSTDYRKQMAGAKVGRRNKTVVR